MAQKLKGVGGVLGSLISEETAATLSQRTDGHVEEATMPPAPAPSVVAERPISHSQGARRGRPPGLRTGEGASKEKTTLRLDKPLMDEYRDWSWEERCQMGELVERALVEYLKKRTRRRAD